MILAFGPSDFLNIEKYNVLKFRKRSNGVNGVSSNETRKKFVMIYYDASKCKGSEFR